MYFRCPWSTVAKTVLLQLLATTKIKLATWGVVELSIIHVNINTQHKMSDENELFCCAAIAAASIVFATAMSRKPLGNS